MVTTITSSSYEKSNLDRVHYNQGNIAKFGGGGGKATILF